MERLPSRLPGWIGVILLSNAPLCPPHSTQPKLELGNPPGSGTTHWHTHVHTTLTGTLWQERASLPYSKGLCVCVCVTVSHYFGWFWAERQCHERRRVLLGSPGWTRLGTAAWAWEPGLWLGQNLQRVSRQITCRRKRRRRRSAVEQHWALWTQPYAYFNSTKWDCG